MSRRSAPPSSLKAAILPLGLGAVLVQVEGHSQTQESELSGSELRAPTRELVLVLAETISQQKHVARRRFAVVRRKYVFGQKSPVKAPAHTEL